MQSLDGWTRVFQSAKSYGLVPFLGSGASATVLPTGVELARQLKEKVEYPDAEERDLARVAQYYQVLYSREYVTRTIVDLMRCTPEKRLQSPPHRYLADLPVSLYLTTNYDDLMEAALLSAGRAPTSLYLDWRSGQPHASRCVAGSELANDREPTPADPIVYHLHGHWDVPNSILVTEDDYIQFLAALHDPDLLPPLCRHSLSSRTLLFVGYALRDWNVRVLLARRARDRPSFSLMVRPQNGVLARFLELDLGARGVGVLWGTAEELLHEFLERGRHFQS